MSDVEIRPTASADLDALANVLVQVYAADGYPVEGVDSPRGWLDLPDAMGQWTALLDGVPVGHIGLHEPGPEAQTVHFAQLSGYAPAEISEIVRLFVSPTARGKGVARKLLRAAVAKSTEASKVATLEVMQKDAAAIDLYTAMGWKVVGRSGHSVGDGRQVPALVMIYRSPTRKEQL